VLITMDEFPLNNNGKIERKKLPKPTYERALPAELLAPRNEVEKAVAKIWSQVLGVTESNLGVDSGKKKYKKKKKRGGGGGGG
jgi:hypothetical protein